jgi:HAD superfamily hydrolase (TIGR01509 family)
MSNLTPPAVSGEIAAVLLDVDGTLVDTTYLHALAWFRALRHAGHLRPLAELHRLIGMGSDQLLAAVVGDEGDHGALTGAWEQEFDRLKRDIVVFPGAPALIGALHDRGVAVVLATSGKGRDVQQLRELLGVDHLLAAVVNADEVERSKPAPDLFRLGLERVGVAPDRAVAVGDTVWDVRAAHALGVPAVAVLSGGVAECELRAEGAAEVYADVGTLADRLDTSPLAGTRV